MPAKLSLQIPKLLLAMDFDNTLVSHIPGFMISVQTLFPDAKVPEELMEIKRSNGWDAFRAECFRWLHQNGVSKDRIVASLAVTPLISGMKELLEWAAGQGEVIVISHSFTLAVEAVLAANDVDQYVSKVIANGSHFTEEGELVVEMDVNAKSPCKQGCRSLCKGDELQAYLARRRSELRDEDAFATVAFAGDGSNDVCPCLRLRRGPDVALARRDTHLARLLVKAIFQGNGEADGLRMMEWTDGYQIRHVLDGDIVAKSGARVA